MLWNNSVLFIGLFLVTITIVSAETDCNKSDSPLSCHGVRVIRNVMHHVIYNQDNGSALKIIPGLEIIESPKSLTETVTPDESVDSDGRSINSVEDDSYIGRVAKYLQSHEIKIKFSELLEKKDFKDVILTAMKSIDEGKGVVEGRKKDKGGLGMIMMMGLMMGKMMGALGLGGVGLLAMKALGVSLLALMLAAIIGIKKLAESGHDDGGHHVQYVSSHSDHHRKRRDIDDSVPLPYKGWTHYAVNTN